MNCLISRSLKKKSSHLSVFLKILFVGYITIGGSAHAEEVTRLDNRSSFSQMESQRSSQEDKAFNLLELAEGGITEAMSVPVDPRSIERFEGFEILPDKGKNDSDEFISTDWIMMNPPVKSPLVTFYDGQTGLEVTKAWSQLTNEEILKLLSNKTAEISIGKFDVYGKVTYAIANTSSEIGKYRVIMDYIPYMVENAIDKSTGNKIGDAKVGVGLRLTADITTKKSNIDLGSLTALGAAADQKKLTGYMRVDIIGISLTNDSGVMLSSTKIDETGIQKTLQTLAVVQSKIADKTTTLDPHIIWVKPVPHIRVKWDNNVPPVSPSFWERIKIRIQNK